MSQYSNCSYQCNRVTNEYFDEALGKMILCPECSQKRKAEIQRGTFDDGSSVAQALGIKNYVDFSFNRNKLIHPTQRVFYTKDVMNTLKDEVEGIYNYFVRKENIPYSICIVLDSHVDMSSVALPLLAKAYEVGLTICPIISAPLYRARVIQDELRAKVLEASEASNYRLPFMERDVVICVIPEGSTDLDVKEAKSLMQARAVNQLPTIFLTTRQPSTLSPLGNATRDTASFYSAFITGLTQRKDTPESIQERQVVERLQAKRQAKTHPKTRNPAKLKAFDKKAMYVPSLASPDSVATTRFGG